MQNVPILSDHIFVLVTRDTSVMDINVKSKKSTNALMDLTTVRLMLTAWTKPGDSDVDVWTVGKETE